MADLRAMLSTARMARNWSLRDAERHTGVPNAHISQIESGMIKRPGLAVLGKLAKGYVLPLRDLLETAGYEVREWPEEDIGQLEHNWRTDREKLVKIRAFADSLGDRSNEPCGGRPSDRRVVAPIQRMLYAILDGTNG
jgi:transcriptional regulator with XRE-family HTH domain